MSYDFTLKCILIGESGCGKSCILYNFLYDKFLDQETTIGVEFGCKTITVPKSRTKVRLQIWDLAGQLTFRSLTKSYYRNSAIALLVYDITRPETYYTIKQWIDKVLELNRESTQLVLIGNKIDLQYRRQISRETAQQFADEHNMLYFETSAKQNQNIQEMFIQPVDYLINNSNSPHLKSIYQTNSVLFDDINDIEIPKKRCC